MDYDESYSIVLGKHTQKLRHKKTHPIKWSTQGGNFPNTYTTNLDLVLTKLDATNSVTWSFHVDDLQKNSWYVMVIGIDFLLEIKLDLRLSD